MDGPPFNNILPLLVEWIGGDIGAGSVSSNFGTYWNPVTPENGGKWGPVKK